MSKKADVLGEKIEETEEQITNAGADATPLQGFSKSIDGVV
jgi:hypothetical protein